MTSSILKNLGIPSHGIVAKQRPKNEDQIGFRVPTELRERLNKIHARHLTSDAGVFRALAEAYCDEAERRKRVVMPLKVVFGEDATKP